MSYYPRPLRRAGVVCYQAELRERRQEMKASEKTCASRIDDAAKEREAQIQALLNDPESDGNDDPALSVETYQVTKIWLSWGGPSDYLEVRHQGREVEGVKYIFSDWFDTASRVVLEDSPLYTYAVEVVEGQLC